MGAVVAHIVDGRGDRVGRQVLGGVRRQRRGGGVTVGGRVEPILPDRPAKDLTCLCPLNRMPRQDGLLLQIRLRLFSRIKNIRYDIVCYFKRVIQKLNFIFHIWENNKPCC